MNLCSTAKDTGLSLHTVMTSPISPLPAQFSVCWVVQEVKYCTNIQAIVYVTCYLSSWKSPPLYPRRIIPQHYIYIYIEKSTTLPAPHNSTALYIYIIVIQYRIISDERVQRYPYENRFPLYSTKEHSRERMC